MLPKVLQDIIRVKDQFYILATSSLADDRTRVLKYGETFAVLNRLGDIESIGLGEQGLYYRGTRHLSRLTLKLADKAPQLLRSTVQRDNAFLSLDMMNPDVHEGERLLPRGSVHLFRSKFLWRQVCYEKLRLANFWTHSVQTSVSLEFAADYVDIFQVRGVKRALSGEPRTAIVDENCVVLSYEGRDGVLRCTRLQFYPLPLRLSENSATFAIILEPKQEVSLCLTTSCEQLGFKPRVFGFERAMEQSFHKAAQERQQFCHIRTSSSRLNAWFSRSEADLHMLISGNPEGAYPYAGVPWFNTVFGRDAILAAMECDWAVPSMAESVLKYLAETQATEIIAEQESEPGRILHEARQGEMANLKEVPFGRYYGSVDATPLFVMLAGAYLESTADRSLVKKIWPNILAALDWIDVYGDADGDGFVEYCAKGSRGLVQQGWKDSHDSVFHSNGELATAPIALCEVQAYVYGAKTAGSRLAREFGHLELAAKLASQAEILRTRFEQEFWDEELGTYVLALDSRKRPCRVRSSNAGHCLWTGIAGLDRSHILVQTLLSDHLFCGWGIRTLGSGEVRYNPMSYHNGSVWPHDNAIIASGLVRYGFKRQALQVMAGLLEASTFMELNRLPELFCGFHKRPAVEGPTLYPVACSPQAWAAGASYLLLGSCLGIRMLGSGQRLEFHSPQLPEGTEQVELTNLRVGNAFADLRLTQNGDAFGVEVLRRSGHVDVQISAD